jgi:hypothetical protein
MSLLAHPRHLALGSDRPLKHSFSLIRAFSDPTAIRPRPSHFPEFAVKVRPRSRSARSSPRLLSDTNSPITCDPVNYASYIPKDIRTIPTFVESAFFQGLIHYIYYHSGNRYNTRELGLQYSGIQPNSDIANILNYQTPNSYESGNLPGQCLTISFRRIRVRPAAFLFRCGPLTAASRHLTSYVLHGWEPSRRIWVVLAERRGFIESGIGVGLVYIDTDLEFSEFRLLQTDQTVPGTHFSIQAIEIHGRVRLMDKDD